MVTQLLFGEHFELLDVKGNWQLIRIAYDSYECWIDKKQFLPVKDTRGIRDSITAVSTEIVQLIEDDKKGIIPIVLGSSLPKLDKKSCMLGKREYFFEGEAAFPFTKNKKKSSEAENSGETAKWYLNAPYLWGGRSPFGIDCSGLTQMVFKLNGVKLKRDAWQQAEQGKALSFLEEARTGDLAFFDNEEGKIVHVGIILPPSSNSPGERKSEDEFRIIHASGKVRIDKLDHHGIFNIETKKYTHRLRVVKRIV